jgi:zinc transport system ATP-binding protein
VSFTNISESSDPDSEHNINRTTAEYGSHGSHAHDHAHHDHELHALTTGPARVRGRCLVDAHSVTMARSGNTVLSDVSFELRAGELTALVGPNGSGKTTLIRILLGLLSQNSGEITWHHETRDVTIGYVPQRARIEADLLASVEEIVATGLLGIKLKRADRSRRIERVLTQVGLSDRAKARLSELSGGQQQRVLIARAMVREPDMLVLDEPVAGVDTAAQQAFHDVLARELETGTAILLVSHELRAVADLVDRVIVLRNHGVEFDGPPSELAARGVSLGVHEHDLPVWLERT